MMATPWATASTCRLNFMQVAIFQYWKETTSYVPSTLIRQTKPQHSDVVCQGYGALVKLKGLTYSLDLTGYRNVKCCYHHHSLRTQMYLLLLLVSTKNNVCEPEPENDFCDVGILNQSQFSSNNPRTTARGIRCEEHSSFILSWNLIGQGRIQKMITSQKSFPGSGSQTLFFGGTKWQPETRLRPLHVGLTVCRIRQRRCIQK